MGLANEVRERLRVEWVDPADPAKGFRHLYLDAADYEALQALAERGGAEIVKAEPTPWPPGPKEEGAELGAAAEPQTVRWVLSDVIGAEDGLGVECLSGSGAIASAYCRAFR